MFFGTLSALQKNISSLQRTRAFGVGIAPFVRKERVHRDEGVDLIASLASFRQVGHWVRRLLDFSCDIAYSPLGGPLTHARQWPTILRL